MVVLVGSCIGLALCPTNAFWLLILLRCLQAAGCASTIALGESETRFRRELLKIYLKSKS
jgi:MFS family permease